jgi:hypothetical protein
MNIPLLKRIAEAIKNKPTEFDMDKFVSYCNTTACIGGWAVWLTEGKPWTVGKSIRATAQQALELTDEQEACLFYVDSWPTVFQDKYSSDVPEIRAEAAAARIRHFIETNGAE